VYVTLTTKVSVAEYVDAYVAVQREKDTSQVPYRVQIPIRYTNERKPLEIFSRSGTRINSVLDKKN